VFDSPVLQAILVALLSLWFFGWVEMVFLSSTRVVFATAFDRLLPEAVSRTTKDGVPYVALLLMLIPSTPVSYLYAFGESFSTYVLDAVLVIALTFLGSAVSAAVLSWRKARDLQRIPDRRLQGPGRTLDHRLVGPIYRVLALLPVPVAQQPGVRHQQSPIARLHAGAVPGGLIIYVAFRLLRRAQGINMNMVYDEIPED